MSVIIQLQNLPLSASSVDIRNFFGGLNIPPGGVHIVGGKKGAAFIAFVNDEDARQAMERNGHRIKDARIKLALSSHRELKEVLEQLHKEQSEFEMSRKVRISETKQERGRSHLRYRRSRSRSLERSCSQRGFSPNDHKSRGKYDDHSQRENLSLNKQRLPYDRLTERKVQYSESYNQEPLSTAKIDQPNPYSSSKHADNPEEERNEEIRRHIESFIAAFGQAENYNMDVKKDAYPSNPFKKGHDSDGFSQPGAKEAIQHNRPQAYPLGQMPMENYQSKLFSDFDSRRHFDELNTDGKVNTSESLQGHLNVTAPYNPSREQEQRPLYNVDGYNFQSQVKSNYSEDRLLNSPMDIEDDKTVNDSGKLQPNQHFGPHVFSTLEMSKVHGEHLSFPMGPNAFNVPPPFQSFESPGGTTRLNPFVKGLAEGMPCGVEAAKDLCIKLEGLPYFATENDLRRVFQGTSIFDLFVQHSSDGKATGIGFVQFASAEDLKVVIKMKYCMIGEHRVEFRGSSRAELMEARMPSSSAVINTEPSTSFEDVLALKRTQDILSSLLTTPESKIPTSYPIAASYPAVSSSYPIIPATSQQPAQPGKRSLCAVITGFPSHFTRHIQVLKCLEDIGINFHLIHLVLNNRARFTGKVFAEFHDLLDLDAALKKHNQSVEGCTIGVKQVLHEEMIKFLNSHRSRCMYPTPKQPDYLEKKPEKSLYIWEPPYEAVDKRAEDNKYKRERAAPAVWFSERARDDQRGVASNGFYSQMNERGFLESSNGIQPFNAGFSNLHESHHYTSGVDPHNVEINRRQFSNTDMYKRVNPADVGDSYSNVNTANESFQKATDFFRGNSEVNVSGRSRDFSPPRSREGKGFTSPRSKEGKGFTSPRRKEGKGFISPRHKEGRGFASLRSKEDGFTSRKSDISTSVRSRERERGHSPTYHRLKREDSPEDPKYKKFKNEGNTGVEVKYLGTFLTKLNARMSQTKPSAVTSQTKPGAGSSQAKPGAGSSQTKPGAGSSQVKPGAGSSQAKPGAGSSQAKPGAGSSQAKPNAGSSQAKPNAGSSQAKPNGRTCQTKPSAETSQAKQICNQAKKHDVLSHSVKGQRMDEELLWKYSGQAAAKSKTDVNSTTQKNIVKIKEASSVPAKKKSTENSPQKGVAAKKQIAMEQSPDAKQERGKVPGKTSSLDNIAAPKHKKKGLEHHRKNCPKRQKIQHVEPEPLRPEERSRHRSDRRDSRTKDSFRTQDIFNRPGCVLEATNVDPHVGLCELLDFFRGYDLQSENLIRRYTDTGDPTSDLRIAFHCRGDAEQAHKILNRQYLKGRPVSLSFV